MNGALVPIMFKHTDVLKYFSAANLAPSIRAVIASEEWYRGLAQKERDVVDAGVKAANRVVQDWANQSDKGALEQLRAAGLTVHVNTPAEREAFAKLIRPNYAEIVDPAVADLFLKLADAQRQ
jgi:TRAP-type transport system periplasmic protein